MIFGIPIVFCVYAICCRNNTNSITSILLIGTDNCLWFLIMPTEEGRMHWQNKYSLPVNMEYILISLFVHILKADEPCLLQGRDCIGEESPASYTNH